MSGCAGATRGRGGASVRSRSEYRLADVVEPPSLFECYESAYEHLVAAAVVDGAGAIVTVNFRDLPPDKAPSHIQVKSPAEFTLETVEIDPERGLRAVQRMAARRRRLPALKIEIEIEIEIEIDDLLEIMATRYNMGAVAGLIRGATI